MTRKYFSTSLLKLLSSLSSSRSYAPPAPALPVGWDPAAGRGEGGEAERRLGPGREVLGRRGGATEHAQRLPRYCERAGGPWRGPLTHQTTDRGCWGMEGVRDWVNSDNQSKQLNTTSLYSSFRPLRQRRTVWGRSWSLSGPSELTSSLPVEKLRNLKSRRPLMRWNINTMFICFRKYFPLCWSTNMIPLSVSQMNAAWEGLNRTWRERMERLEEAMTASVQYQDALQVCVLL